MTTRTRTFWTAMLAAAMAVMMALPAAADHIGNNKAALAGADGVTGQSIANYSKGSDTVQAQARVSGLASGDYTFQLRHNDGRTFEVCSFTVTRGGTDGCSGSVAGVGFHHADIVDDAGTTVATGRYERRGNCREPGQDGSQCQAGTAG